MQTLFCQCLLSLAYLLPRLVKLMPNARGQARQAAGAQRTLFAVACTPLFGPEAAAPPSNGLEHDCRELRRETEIHLADRLIPIL